MIGLDALKAGAAPYLLGLKIGAVAALIGALVYWHYSLQSDAVESAKQAVHADYQKLYNEGVQSAKESAAEVGVLNRKSREILVAGVAAESGRLRAQLAAARADRVPVQAGVTPDQRPSDSGRKDDQRQAERADQVDIAVSDAIAEYRAALLSCGQSVGNVADKLK